MAERRDADHGRKFGLTVADAQRFLRRPRVKVRVSVRIGGAEGTFLTLSKTSVGAALHLKKVADPLPSEFDPVANELLIGSWPALSYARLVSK